MSTVDSFSAVTNRTSFTEGETIHGLVERMACARPRETFLISPETGNMVTFAALRRYACQLVVTLQQLGLSRGDKVAFLMENSLYTTQLFLGLMYGGFVVVPLNVAAGVSQLSYTLDHSDAKVIYVGLEYRDLLESVMANVGRSIHIIPVDLNASPGEDQKEATNSSLMLPRPDDPALLMYTSGSTGQPKAAVHTHKTILAHGRNSISSHQLTSADRSLLVLPLYHINAECVTLVPTLMSGGSVVVPRRFSVAKFWDWLEQFGCTWSAVVPTIISQLLDWQDPRADQRGATFQRIRFLRSSSAPLAPSLHREFLDKFPILLIQAMGSSEAGNIFSNPLPPAQNKIGSTGLPWGFETKIINARGLEVPQGEPGEVLIRGEGLTGSYYKEPEATAAVFDSGGWLHTGDLAYRDADGYFFMVGRSKELIIKGGVNIAPRQIDDVLESHPVVLEAAAVGVPDHHLGEDLVAFVVLRAGLAADERVLLSFCEGRLGHFKTPTRIYFTEDLPKGPSGKVQRLRLLDELPKLKPAGSAAAANGFAVATSTGQLTQEELPALPSSIEDTILDIWKDLLNLRQVGVDDNFFALGGNSLLAIQCLSRLREKIPVRLTVSEFFENSTIAELAALITQRLDRIHGGESQSSAEKSTTWEHAQVQQPTVRVTADVIPQRDRGRPYRLSPLQERIWFMQELNPDLAVYNECEAARLHGELNISALERALNAVVTRHDILRTTFQMVDGQPMAVVHENWTLLLKTIELSGLSVTEGETELERLLISEPRVHYRLQDEPAIRATLIRFAPDDHVFILMMHHLICDWSSLGVLWRELATLYRGFSSGQLVDLPSLPIEHGDYAVWQREHLTETRLAEDLAFWKEKLKGAPPLLELPSDRPRPQVFSYRGARRRFRTNHTLTESLKRFSRREKKSLFGLFTAALKALLYRYAGNQDVSVGIPLAERDRPELQSLIGFMLHTHVLRTKLSGEMTFRELLARVQKGTLELYEHRAAPFDQVVRAVQPERNLSYSPLFQVMLNWRDREQDLSFIGMQGLRIESVLAESRTSKFDLTLTLTDMGDEIWMEVEYSTDLFDEARIARMIGHYQTLLEAVVTNPEQRLDELPLLTGPERNELLVEWNKTNVDYATDVCLHELFERQVRRTPEAVAVEFKGKRFSYRELNERANQLAHYLREMGVGPDTLVGVALERSLEMVVGLYGVLKAGGAYVPIDPEYPQDRVTFMLEDAGVPVLLSKNSMIGQLSRYHGRVVCLDTDSEQIAHQDLANLTRTTVSDNLAYMIYTSGSTGRPKGAMNTHRGICNRLLWMQDQYGLADSDKVLQKTPFSFDVSVWEFFWPLLVGARLVVAEPGCHRDAAYLVKLIREQAITVLHFVPSMLRMFLEQPEVEQCQSLRHVMCSGEALPYDLQEQFFRLLTSQLHNLYGPTEAAVDVTHWTCRRGDERKIVPIGRPVANTQVYVLDRNLQPVPIGIPGELHIGGVQVGRGYHKRPELTAEKFIPDRFSGDLRARLYKTGDVCRWLSDGSIEFWGRADFQVKIRGYRIELEEIEAMLNQQPEIKQALVVAREDKPGDKRLVAYLVPTDTVLAKSELRTRLKQLLPDYMVPADYVVLDSVPLTHNGKVNRLALPAPDQTARVGVESEGYVPPRDSLEQQIAEAWAEVLGLQRVGIRDNFFDLGGHSLLAVRLMLRLQEILPGEALPLKAVLEASTVEQFAIWLCNYKPDDRQFLVRIRHGSSDRPPFFCVHGAGGNVLNMRALAMALPQNLPFFSFQDKGLDGSQPFESIEDAARCYLDELRRVQPHGPYYIGGTCYGGSVAFEMARILERLGESVPLLVLIDSSNHAFTKSMSTGERLFREVRLFIRRTTWHARRISIRQPHELPAYISGRVSALWKRLRMFGKVGPTMLDFDIAPGTRMGENLKRVAQTNILALGKFVPKPYSGDVLIFRASARNLLPYDDFCLGWRSVVRGQVECFEIEGDHMSIMEQPAVQSMAEKLNARLLKASGTPQDQSRPILLSCNYKP